jgi:hypothetical protein
LTAFGVPNKLFLALGGHKTSKSFAKLDSSFHSGRLAQRS